MRRHADRTGRRSPWRGPASPGPARSAAAFVFPPATRARTAVVALAELAGDVGPTWARSWSPWPVTAISGPAAPSGPVLAAEPAAASAPPGVVPDWTGAPESRRLSEIGGIGAAPPSPLSSVISAPSVLRQVSSRPMLDRYQVDAFARLCSRAVCLPTAGAARKFPDLATPAVPRVVRGVRGSWSLERPGPVGTSD